MSLRHLLLLLFVLPLLALAAPRPSEWAQPVGNGKIINLYRISPSIYRSAQLDGPDVASLKKLGIRTVLNLRRFHSDEYLFKGTSVQMVRVPMNAWHIEDEDVVAALKVLQQASPAAPVLIHCQHGADRTGVVSAMYRIVVQGWDKQAAIDEMINGGYGFHPVWDNIRSYIQQVDVARIKAAINR